jgi:hypothetical protein
MADDHFNDCTCTNLLSLFSPFYLNLPKVDFLYAFVAKMEFKLKLCFQNDLIRFIGDKLDKISKLILVCMRYFILIEISYFIRGDNL